MEKGVNRAEASREIDSKVLAGLEKFLEDLGDVNYALERESDGACFIIYPPHEDALERRAQMRRLGSLEPTAFDKRVVLPFVKRIGEHADLRWKMKRSTELEVIEIAVSRIF
jgi:hypothetical protein